MRAVTLLLVLASSCGETSVDVDLELALGDCQEVELAQISLLSVEVYGSHEGLPCALARRCVNVDSPQSVAELTAALRSVNQPLVDTPADRADLIVVSGHSSNDCFGYLDREVCGTADIRDADQGALTVSLDCGACSEERFPLCP